MFLYLHRKQLRIVIIQFLIAQDFKVNRTYDYCNKSKRKQKTFKMYKSKNLEPFMKSRSNSKYSQEKNVGSWNRYKDKILVHWKRFVTFFTETELQIDWKSILNKWRSSKPKYVFEKKIYFLHS